jgi:hypothetical protein
LAPVDLANFWGGRGLAASATFNNLSAISYLGKKDIHIYLS